MNSSAQENLNNPLQPAVPSVPHLLLFVLLSGWLAASPVIVGLIAEFLPADWPLGLSQGTSGLLLAGFLLIPLAGFAGLVRWRRWTNLWPLTLALLMTGLYIAVAVFIRAVSEPDSNQEIFLRLTLLTFVALGVGGLSLLRADISASKLSRVLGLRRPSLVGLLITLSVMTLLTIGWPLSGALGDSWASWLILLRALAISLPEEILFRGALLGLLIYSFQRRPALAVLAALLIYVAFTPSMIVPHNDWSKLVLLVSAIPFALLTIELRAVTGSLWAGLLFAVAYRAFPLLFTDSRVELAIISQPWQTLARLWMVLGAGVLALILWAGRRWLSPRWRLSRTATLGVALAGTFFLSATWAGGWYWIGQPGFHNDGFLIIMEGQADLSGAGEIDDIVTRRAFVHERLIETAEEAQAPVREALERAGLAYRPYYLINMIQVEGHHRRMAEFGALPGVARVMLNPNVRPFPFDFDVGYGPGPDDGQGVAWNISQTQADEVWELGITGQGIVVAGQDTGYDWQHPALRRAYRGSNGSGEAEHAYNWHDAWADSAVPIDDDQHGTHTMGTILGDDGQSNQIGVAPAAQWIGCRNMRRGLGNPASYTACMEFFLAPYPHGGDPFTDGEVSLAPHLVNNSWGCPDFEGCDDEVLQPAAEALRAAGIMMIVSAGNAGPSCQTAIEPPARYDSVFSVGATNDFGLIAGFSSRGPVPNAAQEDDSDQTHLLKPDIVAPGDNVRSSVPGGGYGTASGTSMAGPHVAGLVALLWSANSDLIGQIEATEQIIRQSARPVEVNTVCTLEPRNLDDDTLLDDLESLAGGNVCACGEVTGHPNNVYGWGEIDALAAVRLALEWE